MSQPALVPHAYIVEQQVGSGTSGVVYRARHRASQQLVALKLLRTLADRDPRSLLQEAELLSQLQDPGIVRILDQGITLQGQPFIAMEWLDGEDLSQRQARSPLPIMSALRLMLQLTRGLHTAHEAGVVHRDIKPANIFLTYPHGDETLPVPKLLDFGAAAHFLSLATLETSIVGTPAYMSPEQVRGDRSVDRRSDVYSLGATLYEVLVGHPPHQGTSTLATLARLATTRPRRPIELRPELPLALDDLVHRMLATDAEHRPVDMQEVGASLQDLIQRITRGSIIETEPHSQRRGSSASRLLTTLVASRFAERATRDRALKHVQARGTEAVPLGADSLVAHFGARRALGNEAESALKIGQRLAQWGAAVGVATGRAFVPIVDSTQPVQAIGEVVDRATLLARTAAPSEVWTDTTTRELGRELYEFTARGRDVAQVVERKLMSQPRAGVETPFVGRDAELARLDTAQERALRGKRAVVATLSGSPGIGKTRLQREAIARLLGRNLLRHHITQRSEPYGAKRALGVALDVLRTLLKLQKSNDSQAAVLAIRNVIDQQLDEPLRARIGLFAQLLSQQQVPLEEDTRGLRDVLWLFMTQTAISELEQGPLAIVIEDLQWADPESVQWLDHLLGQAAHLPLFMLITARQDFWQEKQDCFAGRDRVHIELQPISTEATRRIATSAGDGRLSQQAIESIVQQASGSPLFAEELTRLAIVGANVSQAPTIEAAIQVSIDALKEYQQDAFARLSVLGQIGGEEALEVLGVGDAEVALQELQRAGLVVPHRPSRFPETHEWHFKHALLREVVYQSLGEEQQRRLHAQAAEWLTRVAEDPTVIARHYDLAQQPERAAEFWALAAQRALSTNALGDALTMAERALAFAENEPQAFSRARLLDEAWSRLDARGSDRETAISALEEHVFDDASRTYALGARARYDAARGQGFEVNERLAEARDRARDLGLGDEEARCSAELAARLAFAGRFDEAEQEAAHLLRLSEQPSLRAASVDAWQTLAIVRQSRGELSQAFEARRNAAHAAQQSDLRERESMLTTNLGFALTTLGAREESRGLLLRGAQLAEAIGSQGARRHAQMLLLGWCAAFGNDRELEGPLAELRAEADNAADGTWTAPARENLGVLFYRGLELLNNYGGPQRERSRALLQLSAESYQRTHNRDVLPVALGCWARAEIQCGNHAKAHQLATQAAELLRSGAPSLLNESPVYLALHDAELKLGNTAAARSAIAAAMPPLVRRIRGLDPTEYARPFLTALADNSKLVAMAESYGVLPDEVRQQLTRGVS